MTEVEVTNTIDVTAMPGDTAVVVVLEDNVEVIQTMEQGPPGPKGDKGDRGDKGDPGNTVLYGPADPQNYADGEDGNFWINTTTHFIFGPRVNGIWPAGTSMIGPQGPQGIPGNTVLYGAADPVAGTGVNGNFYINTTTHFMFGPKAAGAWPAGTSLVGPQGVRGSKFYVGSGAPGAIAGQADGDDYLNAANGDVYTRAAGSWGAPVGNIRGPQGPAGPGIAEAPTDGFTYGRVNGAWAKALPLGASNEATRASISAAPFDAIGYFGMQVNGGHEVTQERIAGNGMPSNGYFCDGWQVARAGTSAGYAFSAGQIVGGIPASMASYPTVAQAAMGAADYLTFYQFIEGNRIARLNWGTAGAQPLTLCFWSAHFRTGTYTGVVKNGAQNRTCAFTYNHAASDVAQFNVVTILGDTAGTWPKDNSIGMVVMFAMACGSTYSAPVANAWLGANYVAGPGQVNGIAAMTDYFRIGGVAILPGIEAPPATRSPFITRPFDQELAICQRYYEKSFPYLTAPIAGVGSFNGAFEFNQVSGAGVVSVLATVPLVRKRATPTVTIYNPAVANNQVRGISASADFTSTGTAQVGENSFSIVGAGPAGSALGHSSGFHWVADARL